MDIMKMYAAHGSLKSSASEAHQIEMAETLNKRMNAVAAASGTKKKAVYCRTYANLWDHLKGFYFHASNIAGVCAHISTPRTLRGLHVPPSCLSRTPCTRCS